MDTKGTGTRTRSMDEADAAVVVALLGAAANEDETLRAALDGRGLPGPRAAYERELEGEEEEGEAAEGADDDEEDELSESSEDPTVEDSEADVLDALEEVQEAKAVALALTEAAGARERPLLACHVTGFGPFAGVSNNPTTELVQALPAFLEAQPGRHSHRLRLTQGVVETSRAGAADAVASLYGDSGAHAEERRLVIHFGVDAGASGFKCEAVAHNMADFRVPDERGEQPRHTPIAPDQDLDTPVPSNAPVDVLVRALAARGHGVQLSADAGRFLCNFLFFRSLMEARARAGSTWCLFVHVPPFWRVAKEQQLEFARDLLDELYDAIHRPATPVQQGDAPHGSLRGAPAPAIPSPVSPLVETLCLTGFDRADAEMIVAVCEIDAATKDADDARGARSDLASIFIQSTGPTLREAMEVVKMQTGSDAEIAARGGEHKLVLAVRTDLGMGKGKIAAQCCHAALEAYRLASQTAGDAVMSWEADGEPIICVKAPKGKEQLDALEAMARACDVCAARVVDAGRTQIESGTPTVLAVGPAPVELVDLVTGRLRLL